MLLDCGFGEDSWESLGLQGDLTASLKREASLNIHWKDCCWSWTPILWPPDAKSWLIGKDSDAGKDWGQEEKGMMEDEMVEWHHPLELEMTEWLNWTELMLNSSPFKFQKFRWRNFVPPFYLDGHQRAAWKRIHYHM